METLGHRRRLKKKQLPEDSDPDNSDFQIPKKHELDRAKKRVESFPSLTKPHGLGGLEDEDSLDEFITDKIEYFKDALPSSSEESAHSTDEENGRSRKRSRKKPKTPSEESAEDTESSGDEMQEAKATPIEVDDQKSEEQKSEELDSKGKQKVLLGKKALEEKRAKGLLPPKETKEKAKKEKPAKKMKKATPETLSPEKPKKRRKETEAIGKYVQFGEFDESEDRKKAELVTKLLCRWWYVLEEWPPAKFDYSERLRAQKLRVVGEETWNIEALLNPQGFEKVRHVPNFPGLFQSSRGVIHDLRPQELCPCFDNLFKKPLKTIRNLLVTALEKQLEELEAQPNYDRLLSGRLKREIEYEKSKVSSS